MIICLYVVIKVGCCRISAVVVVAVKLFVVGFIKGLKTAGLSVIRIGILRCVN
jgi:hypothetical protein